MNEDYLPPDEASDVYAGEDDPSAYTVVSLDPGGTTGWAVFSVHPEAMGPDPEIRVSVNILWWTAGEFTGVLEDQADEVVELCASWPGARLVTEDFKLRQVAADLAPVELNAMLKWALRPRYFVKQSASLAMITVTDDRQKEWGFWIPGKPHARDAVKHNLTFLWRQKERLVRTNSKGVGAQ